MVWDQEGNVVLDAALRLCCIWRYLKALAQKVMLRRLIAWWGKIRRSLFACNTHCSRDGNQYTDIRTPPAGCEKFGKHLKWGNYICRQCIQLQLLTDWVRGLEPQLQLDNLSIIWETEGLIGRSYSEVIKPKVQAENRWVTTRIGSRQRVQESPLDIHLENR